VTLTSYLVLSGILFSIGAATVLVRRNAIIVFMGIELMLNATNLAFVTFARMHGDLNGQIMAFFVMVVAAAEVVVGLAIIVAIFRTRRSASVDDVNLLKSWGERRRDCDYSLRRRTGICRGGRDFFAGLATNCNSAA